MLLATMVALGLVPAGCSKDETADPIDRCAAVTCPQNAKCLVDGDAPSCLCNADFVRDGEACIASRQVDCASSVPDHAVPTPAQVTVAYTTADGWSMPADCAWQCQTAYVLDGGLCIDRKIVACEPGTVEHATPVLSDVVVHYTPQDGWEEPAACDWACVADFDRVEDACIDRQTVPCAADPDKPANSHDVVADVQSTFTTSQGWNTPACEWACDTEHAVVAGECLHRQMVGCALLEMLPPNAQNVVVPVEVTYSSVSQAWSTPASCTWECRMGYALDGDACAKTVGFNDLKLEECVRLLLNQPTGVILQSAVAAITDLDCSNSGITDLEGLQDFTALATLALNGNAIVDVGPLASLTQLTSVNLTGNCIHRFTPILDFIKVRKVVGWNLQTPECIVCPDGFANRQGSNCWSDVSAVVNWSGAVSYCEGLGGRLPIIDELRTMIINCPLTVLGGTCGASDSSCLSNDASCFTHETCRTCGYSEGGHSIFTSDFYNVLWSSSEMPEPNPGWAWGFYYYYGSVEPFQKESIGLFETVGRCLP
jgi:hypothetical protein